MEKKEYQYTTQGTCSRMINIVMKDGVIDGIGFVGGCHGNLQGISSLVRGMRPEEVIERPEGIRCGNKPTSCPDQLSKALRQIIDSE